MCPAGAVPVIAVEAVVDCGRCRAGFAGDPGAAVELSDAVPVEPGEPVESASATGMAQIAEPMPSTTASAPTRPM